MRINVQYITVVEQEDSSITMFVNADIYSKRHNLIESSALLERGWKEGFGVENYPGKRDAKKPRCVCASA